VLFLTDGVVEGVSPSGEPFGVDRLADLWAREAASDEPPEEISRRLVAHVLRYSLSALRDDTTLMQICWDGART
jgi:serine phosphatase RsbU (regulator of sigma subunit)